MNAEVRSAGVLVTAVNPAFVPTEGFPATNRPSLLTVSAARVADAIVKVLREGIAPQYSVLRWPAPGQVVRVLTPTLHRGAMALALRRFGC
ncbi:MAG TPA: hypothetical protein VNO34_06025 [Actinomycetota bacterium]|nr:hypothetical protein [Actinomycetota bacterium]